MSSRWLDRPPVRTRRVEKISRRDRPARIVAHGRKLPLASPQNMGLLPYVGGDLHHQLYSIINGVERFSTFPTVLDTVFPCCGHGIGRRLAAMES